jgi:hypothetical protein
MALMLGSLRDALVDAGASADKADKAAEEAAGYENRLAKIETDVALLKWMGGVNIALTVVVLGKVLFL